MPKEHQVDISMEEQIKVSVEGTTRILDCLERNQVKATFFCTANFALHAPDIIKRIQEGGHEIASHGFYHWTFEVEDLKRSKDQLEEITGTKVYGYRQARMMPVSEKAVYEAGYIYNSSLNPTFIPGRYMRLSTPRTPFIKDRVMQCRHQLLLCCVSLYFGFHVIICPLHFIAGCVNTLIGMMDIL